MLVKAAQVQIKAASGDRGADGLEHGQFEAVVSVFGNKDSYGDVVMPGAFADTLADWVKSGNPIPVYWSHRMDDPDYNIGSVLDAKETDQGLYVKAQLDMDNPKAAQVHKLLAGRRVTQFSFAYDVLDGAMAKSEELGDYYELRKLKLYEVGPTPIGANQETELLAVKMAGEQAAAIAASLKAGRVLSAKNEKALRDAHAALSTAAGHVKGVLDALDGATQDDAEKSSSTDGPPPAAATPPAKGEQQAEASRAVSVGFWAASTELELLKGDVL